MKLQTLALGLAFALAGSAFAATTRDVTVTHDTPNGTITRHIVRTHEDSRDFGRHHLRRVVVVHPQHHRHHRKVVIVEPTHHRHHHADRTVVVHRHYG
jgi:hypothetical protein